MPIGKNSIKRVNNGYSKVKTSAPDMENSTVIAKPDAQVENVIIKEVEKKTAAKKAPAKITAEKKPAAKKEADKKSAVKGGAKPTAKKEAAKKAPSLKEEKKADGFEKFSLGCDLPTYLL